MKYYVGFDIGGTNIAMEIENENGEICVSDVIPFPKGENYDCAVKKMAEMIFANHISADQISGIGVSVPGSVDIKAGVVLNAYNLGFHDAPLVEELKTWFPHAGINIINDADAALLAEYSSGALKGYETAVLLTLGTGLGAAVLIDGKPFLGGTNRGTEAGHMIIANGGELCTCGNRGCAETVTTATWLADTGRKTLKTKKDSLIAERSGEDESSVTAKLVIDCAKSGDQAAMEIFSRYVDNLGTVITNYINIFCPQLIAIGGGVSNSGDFLFEPLRKDVERKSRFFPPCKIIPAFYGDGAGVKGALFLAEQK